MFFWNSRAFLIQWMLAIWSLVPLPFLNPAWTTGKDPGERSNDPTRHCPGLPCGCLGVSSRGVGRWWPAAGLGALSVAVHAWDLLKEVTIIFIKVKVKPLSRVRLFATPWTAAYQAPPSMVFSRQEYWSGVSLPSLKGQDRMTYIIILTIILLLNIRIIPCSKSDKTQNISEDIWIFPNKQLLSNAVLQNSMQEAVIEFSGSTPEQWTKQTNKMLRANENLVVESSEAPVGHGVKYWDD